MNSKNTKRNTTHKRKHKEEANTVPKLSKMVSQNWSELYVTKDYCKDQNQDEVYARASNDVEMFNDKADKIRYARRKKRNANDEFEEIEFAPKRENQLQFLADPPKNLATNEVVVYELDPATGFLKYPVNDSGSEYYHTDKNGDHIVIVRGNTEIYAKDVLGNEIYPKDRNGDDFFVRDDVQSNTFKYARDKDQNELYALTKEQSQKYRMENSEEIAARDKDGNEYYAKNEIGGEFYPKYYVENGEALEEYLKDHQNRIQGKIGNV